VGKASAEEWLAHFAEDVFGGPSWLKTKATKMFVDHMLKTLSQEKMAYLFPRHLNGAA